MRKVVSPILSAAILGGALLLCPPSHAAPISTHANDDPAGYHVPMRLKCLNLNGYKLACP